MTKKKLTLSLSVTAVIGVLAAGGAVAFASIPGSGAVAAGDGAQAPAQPVVLASDPADVKITKECVLATRGVPDPGSWRPGAKLDLDAPRGFLVIRNDRF